MPSLRGRTFHRLVFLAAAAVLAGACQSDGATSPLVPRRANSVLAAPAQKAARVAIADLVLSSTPMTLGGGAILYQITISNSGSTDATGVSIQSEVDQGHRIGRAGGSTDASCGGGAGVVPPGQCTMVLSARADNAASGNGTLAPGAAKITISVNQPNRASTKQSDSQTLNTSIVAETHTAPYMSDVLPGFSSLVIDDVDHQPPYTVAVFNPTATDQSLYVVQAYVNQGDVSHGAGGSNVLCFPNSANGGTIPPGTCTFSFTTSASNPIDQPGTLVAGPAVWRLELVYHDGTNPDATIDFREFSIALTGP